MGIANLIARGIGFAPGSTKFIPTHGLIAGEPAAERGDAVGYPMFRNLDLIRGQEISFSGVVRDADGQPIDISEDVLTWRLGLLDMNVTFRTLTVGDGITVTDGPNGAYRVDIKALKTEGLEALVYDHQGEGKHESIVYGFVRGRIRVEGDLS